MYADLVGAISLFCGDQRTAEDVAQETLIDLWQRRAELADPRAWAYRYAFNTVKSAFRRRAAERRALARMSRERPAIVDQLGAVEQDLDLRRGLAALPNRQREAVLLYYLADFDTTQTARTMGCSQGAVKAHLSRGLAALRRSGLADQLTLDESENVK
ncbi:MAG TPA: sigma-70 family RNA polymerase sigma factor [Frankiaceae bacterium]|nr:sigma-70 family RNA polymerase sigma factor [Frankiaceae bacterium]